MYVSMHQLVHVYMLIFKGLLVYHIKKVSDLGPKTFSDLFAASVSKCNLSVSLFFLWVCNFLVLSNCSALSAINCTYMYMYTYLFFAVYKFSLYLFANESQAGKLILARICPGTVSLAISDRQPPHKPSGTSSHAY